MAQRMRLDGSNYDFHQDLQQFFKDNNITAKDIEDFDLEAFLGELPPD